MRNGRVRDCQVLRGHGNAFGGTYLSRVFFLHRCLDHLSPYHDGQPSSFFLLLEVHPQFSIPKLSGFIPKEQSAELHQRIRACFAVVRLPASQPDHKLDRNTVHSRSRFTPARLDQSCLYPSISSSPFSPLAVPSIPRSSAMGHEPGSRHKGAGRRYPRSQGTHSLRMAASRHRLPLCQSRLPTYPCLWPPDLVVCAFIPFLAAHILSPDQP